MQNLRSSYPGGSERLRPRVRSKQVWNHLQGHRSDACLLRSAPQVGILSSKLGSEEDLLLKLGSEAHHHGAPKPVGDRLPLRLPTASSRKRCACARSCSST